MNRRKSQARPFTADRLNAALHEVGSLARPSYLDDIVARAHRTRQRPAWTLPERWLPMDVARQPVIAPRLPLRSVGAWAPGPRIDPDRYRPDRRRLQTQPATSVRTRAERRGRLLSRR